MNQNIMMLTIFGRNSEKYKGKPEILPNDSASDVKKTPASSYAERTHTATKVNYLDKGYCKLKAIKL